MRCGPVPAWVDCDTQGSVTPDQRPRIVDRSSSGFDVVTPDGTRFTVDGASEHSTLADLLQAIEATGTRVDGITVDGTTVDGTTVDGITVDGTTASTEQRLIDCGVRHGVEIGFDPTRRAAHNEGARQASVELVWIAGPDAGGIVELAPGVHLIGRSSSVAVQCRDPKLELHHVRLTLGDDGMVLTQLSGSQRIKVDDVPVDESTYVDIGSRVEIGSSVFELRSTGCVAAREERCAPFVAGHRQTGELWWVPFVRAPRPMRVFDPPELTLPRPPTPHTTSSGGLLPSALGVCGAAVMALVLHQLMFLLFGLMGAMVALGTWAAQRHGDRRSRTAERRRHEAATSDFNNALQAQRSAARSVHVATTPTVESALRTMTQRLANLWAVRSDDPDAFTVSLGLGDVFFTPNVADLHSETDNEAMTAALRTIESVRHLGNLPFAVQIAPATVTALRGLPSMTAAVARAIVMQLAASSGPADWQLGMVVENLTEWTCLSWLAHMADTAGKPMIVDAARIADLTGGLDPDDQRLLVLVVDRPHLLAARTSPLRRLLAGRRPVAVVLLCALTADVPAVVTRLLDIGGDSIANWTPDVRANLEPVRVRVAGLCVERTRTGASAIACFRDPEFVDASTTLPREVSIMELLGVRGCDSEVLGRQIAADWMAVKGNSSPCAPLGVAADGVVEIDLVNDGPHVLIAGTTGAGKSELLRTLVVGLATRLSPDEITFVLVDYKGGSTFDACADLPHVVGLVSDLDGHLGARALRSLEAELRRREHALRRVGATDLIAYRSMQASAAAGHSLQALPRLVVVVDEFATLAVQQPDFVGALLGVAQRGRSLGVHLVLATQRPSGVISDDIRANTNLRIALRVQDVADSNDVIGEATAAALPCGLAGRAIMRLGNQELLTFQTARSTGALSRDITPRLVVSRSGASNESCRVDGAADVRTELEVLVLAVGNAAQYNGVAAPHRPWLTPLAHVIDADALEPGAIGVIDDPDHQTQPSLRWNPSDGHHLIVGASGMGTTSALLALASVIDHDHASTELFVIDAMGDPRLREIERTRSCAAVVGVRDRERLSRLLATLDRERSDRKMRSTLDAPSRIVLLIDGFGALRAELETDDLFEQMSQLDAVISEGQSVGITVILATAQASALPSQVLGLIARRWVFNLADPFDATLLGLPPSLVPTAIPGRFIDVTSRLEAQLALPRPVERRPRRHRGDTSRFRALDSLPSELGLSTLRPGRHFDHDDELPMGMSYTTLEPSILNVPGGEHVLVIGPYRSGRTTALDTASTSWQLVHPSGWIASLSPRRNSAKVGSVYTDTATMCNDIPADASALLVIDDAELVDDSSGSLATLIGSRRENVTIVAAARPDALRSLYGHWTQLVRRSRLGLVMASCSDIDGDLFNTVLPRRLPIASRPGLAWMVADGQMQLLQIARVDRCAANVAGVSAT